MAALTPTDIANMALGILTEAPIDNLDEDSKAARLCNLHFETTREAALQKHAWVFAVKRVEVDPAETSGAWRWAYEMPADALRILPVMDGDIEIDWTREGSQVLTHCGGTRVMRYVANIIDPNDWPAVFTEVLAAALAVKIAHPLTGKSNMVQMAKDAYSDAVREALRVNAIEKKGHCPRSSWIEARGGTYRGNARARHGAGW